MAESCFPPSRVPGDADLWPGETPFTSFGQYGIDMLDLRVFDQDVWWVDLFGSPHLIEEMSDEYVANVIAHLEAHVVAFCYDSMRRSLVQMLGDTLLGRANEAWYDPRRRHTALGMLAPTHSRTITPPRSPRHAHHTTRVQRTGAGSPNPHDE